MSFHIEFQQPGCTWQRFPLKKPLTTLPVAGNVLRGLRAFYPKASWRFVDVLTSERVEPKLPETSFPASVFVLRTRDIDFFPTKPKERELFKREQYFRKVNL